MRNSYTSTVPLLIYQLQGPWFISELGLHSVLFHMLFSGLSTPIGVNEYASIVNTAL